MSARAATAAGVGASSIRMMRSVRLEAERSRLLLGHRPILRRRSGGSRRRRRSRTPAARRITSCAMLPSPSRPSVRPHRPRAFEYSFLFHLPARSSATLSGMRRSSASISANVELGDRDRVLARAVGHVDAARRRRRHVDRVVAGAGAHDERQPSGVEHRPRSPSCCARRARRRRSSASPRSGGRP